MWCVKIWDCNIWSYSSLKGEETAEWVCEGWVDYTSATISFIWAEKQKSIAFSFLSSIHFFKTSYGLVTSMTSLWCHFVYLIVNFCILLKDLFVKTLHMGLNCTWLSFDKMSNPATTIWRYRLQILSPFLKMFSFLELMTSLKLFYYSIYRKYLEFQ